MIKKKHDESVEYVANILRESIEEVLVTQEMDMEIDIIAELENGEAIRIVVRSASPDSQYTWISQNKFDISDDRLYMAVVYEKIPSNKVIYLIPSIKWQNSKEIFKTKNYGKPGQVSKPEYGINFSQKTIDEIESLELSKVLPKIIA